MKMKTAQYLKSSKHLFFAVFSFFNNHWLNCFRLEAVHGINFVKLYRFISTFWESHQTAKQESFPERVVYKLKHVENRIQSCCFVLFLFCFTFKTCCILLQWQHILCCPENSVRATRKIVAFKKDRIFHLTIHSWNIYCIKYKYNHHYLVVKITIRNPLFNMICLWLDILVQQRHGTQDVQTNNKCKCQRTPPTFLTRQERHRLFH